MEIIPEGNRGYGDKETHKNKKKPAPFCCLFFDRSRLSRVYRHLSPKGKTLLLSTACAPPSPRFIVHRVIVGTGNPVDSLRLLLVLARRLVCLRPFLRVGALRLLGCFLVALSHRSLHLPDSPLELDFKLG